MGDSGGDGGATSTTIVYLWKTCEAVGLGIVVVMVVLLLLYINGRPVRLPIEKGQMLMVLLWLTHCVFT